MAHRGDHESIPIEPAIQNHVAEAPIVLRFGAEHEASPVDPRHGLQIDPGCPSPDYITGDAERLGIDPDDRVTVLTWSPESSVLIDGKPRQTDDVSV